MKSPRLLAALALASFLAAPGLAPAASAEKHLVALALNATLNGLPAVELGTADTATPVIVRGKHTSADPVDNLKDAYVYPAKGRPCLLSDVADVEKYRDAACIERRHGETVVTLVADAATGPIRTKRKKRRAA